MPLLNQEFIQRLQEQLLSTNEETCSKGLSSLKEEVHLSDILAFYPILEIISQLHPSAAIQSQALALLSAHYTPSQIKEVEENFAIFTSIETLMPWDDSDNIYKQINNYNSFNEDSARLVPVMCQNSFYKEKILNLAQQLYLLYDLRDISIALLEQLLQHDAQNTEAYYALSRIILQNGEKYRAIALLEACLSINQEHFYALTTLAPLAAEVLEKNEYAISLYEKAIAIEPYSPDLYAACAGLYYKEKQFARAQQFIEIALGINPYNIQALTVLGDYYVNIEEDYQKAVEVYEKGFEDPIHGDNPILLGKLAELYTKYLLEYDKAKLCYEKSLQAKEDQPELLAAYSQLLVEVYQDTDAALAQLLAHENKFGKHAAIEKQIQKLQPQKVDTSNLYINNVDLDDNFAITQLFDAEEEEEEWIEGDSASDE